jgi:hypothetical protein
MDGRISECLEESTKPLVTHDGVVIDVCEDIPMSCPGSGMATIVETHLGHRDVPHSLVVPRRHGFLEFPVASVVKKKDFVVQFI